MDHRQKNLFSASQDNHSPGATGSQTASNIAETTVIITMTVLILYGSETGTSEEVAFKLHRLMSPFLEEESHIYSMDEYEVSKLPSEQFVIFVVSTTGDGDAPATMKKFWGFLLRKGLPADSLQRLSVAVFGLGDSSYEKFNAAARKLSKRLQQLGANELLPVGLGDDQDKHGYFTALDPWVSKLLQLVQKSPSVARTPGSSAVFPEESEYVVDFLDRGHCGNDDAAAPAAPAPAAPAPAAPTSQTAATDVSTELERLISRPESEGLFRPPMTAKHHYLSESSCRLIVASAKENNRITHTSSEQDVRSIVLSLQSPLGGRQARSPLSAAEVHAAGDVATVCPRNDPTMVSRLLGLFSYHGDMRVSIRLRRRAQLCGGSSSVTTSDGSSNNSSRVTTSGSSSSSNSGGGAITSDFGASVDNCMSHGLKRKRRSRVGEVAECSLLTLFSALLDVCGVPQRGFFEGLARFASNAEEREKLIEISSPEGTDLYYDYCLKEKRSHVEVLEDFRSARPPLPDLLSLLPALQPRHYSIANSGLVTPHEIHLCVAVATTKTPYGRRKVGVCSGYLSSLQPGDRVALWVTSGFFSLSHTDFPRVIAGESRALPSPSVSTIPSVERSTTGVPASVPLILIGPGTGVAPMRAILQERRHLRAQPEATSTSGATHTAGQGQTVLFFGCRNRSKDYLYGEEWDRIGSQLPPLDNDPSSTAASYPTSPPPLEAVITAFSRDQPQKVYVTDKLRAHGAFVWRLLDQGAAIFVSGSAKRMPSDVRAALKDIVAKHGGRSLEEASTLLQVMERQKRYVVEAWS